MTTFPHPSRRLAPVLALGSMLVVLCVATLLLSCGKERERKPKRSVVLISIDTLRADHLGIYGYERDTSPNIDRFAAQNIVFERAYASSYQTAESHMSVFTSLNPSVHRVYNGAVTRGGMLYPDVDTLPQRFAAHGYRTAGFHGGGNVSASIGFDRGFEVYEQTPKVEPAIEWLRDRPEGKPFFLFFHTYEVHDPYVPEPPYDNFFSPDYHGDKVFDAEEYRVIKRDQGGRVARDLFWSQFDQEDPDDIQRLIDLYDGGIRQVDVEIGKLLDAVVELAPKATIILMSDHGEQFGEHGGFLHGHLWEELLHVPLIVRAPHMNIQGRVPYTVSLLDLGPTILDLAGVPVMKPRQGRSLIPMMRGNKRENNRIFAEKIYPHRSRNAVLGHNMALIDQGRHKLMFYKSLQPMVYDLLLDPGEQHDLCDDKEECRDLIRRVRRQSKANERLRRKLGVPRDEIREGELDDELREQLEALGYI